MGAGSSSINGVQAGNPRMFAAAGPLTQTAISSIATTAAGHLNQKSRGPGPLIITAAGPKCTVDVAGLGYLGRFGPDRGFLGDRGRITPATASAGRRCLLKLDAIWT